MVQYTTTQVRSGVWVYSWVPDPGAAYEIWLYGTLLEITSVGAGTYTTPEGFPTDVPPPLEIHSTLSPNKAQSREYSPKHTLQWRGILGAAGYVIEQLRDGVWYPIASKTENKSGWYSYTTEPLIDGEVNQFVNKALDVRGVAGDDVSVSVAVVCNPLPPKVTTTLTGGNIIVESE